MNTIGWLPSRTKLKARDSVVLRGIPYLPDGQYTIDSALTIACPYCGGSGLGCCEHAGDSVAKLNKRVREGAD